MPEFDENTPRLPVEDLRRVAGYQRWLIAAVLAQWTLWGVLLFLSGFGRGFRGDMHFPLLLTGILAGGGGLYAFLIYCTIRNPVWATVVGLASSLTFLSMIAFRVSRELTPFLAIFGILVLTTVNSATTRVLTANGVKVGLFGADLDTIEDQGGFYDEDEEDPGW